MRAETSKKITGRANNVGDDLENSLLTWTEDGVVFVIAGRIGQDEVLKVAESLQ